MGMSNRFTYFSLRFCAADETVSAPLGHPSGEKTTRGENRGIKQSKSGKAKTQNSFKVHPREKSNHFEEVCQGTEYQRG
jgi:hypothetical protein